MQPVVLFLVGLSMSVGVLAASAPCYAGDTTLFYAPAATPVPPMILEGPRGATRLNGSNGATRLEGSKGAAARLAPPHERVCFNPSEARERIVKHKLSELFQALQVGRLQGDALRAKLCRWKPDQFVYEVAVLRRDGHIVHVYMNAQNGQNVGP